MVEGQIQPAEMGPARKVYHITDAGREARRTGLLDALSHPDPRYPPLLLGVANLPAIRPSEAVAALQQYQLALVDRLSHVRARQGRLQPLPYFVSAMFDYSIATIEAELTWIADFILQVEERDVQD
jgi:hypothetical protein